MGIIGCVLGVCHIIDYLQVLTALLV